MAQVRCFHVGRVVLVTVRVFIFSRCVLTIYGATKAVTSLSGFKLSALRPFLNSSVSWVADIIWSTRYRVSVCGMK